MKYKIAFLFIVNTLMILALPRNAFAQNSGTILVHVAQQRHYLDSIKWQEQTPLGPTYLGKKIKRMLLQRSSGRVMVFIKGNTEEISIDDAVKAGLLEAPLVTITSTESTALQPIFIKVDSPLYIGVNNHVKCNGIDSTDYYLDHIDSVENSPGYIKGSSFNGEYDINPFHPGSLTLLFHNRQKDKPDYSFIYFIKYLPKDELNKEPKIMLGNDTAQQINYSRLKQDEEIKLSDSNFSLVSATVYFVGQQFRAIVVSSITADTTGETKSFIDQCLPGSSIIFDNVKVKDQKGKEYILNTPNSFLITDDFTGSTIAPLVYPEFPGGDIAASNYLDKGLADDQNEIKENTGCLLTFIVSEDGSIIDTKLKWTLPPTPLEQRCLELIEKGPRWIPGSYNVKKITMLCQEYIDFL
jgi:hypothetical protein